MKLRLLTASGAFVANVEVGGVDYPKLVRWGDRVFEFAALPEQEGSPASYREIDIPLARFVV